MRMFLGEAAERRLEERKSRHERRRSNAVSSACADISATISGRRKALVRKGPTRESPPRRKVRGKRFASQNDPFSRGGTRRTA